MSNPVVLVVGAGPGVGASVARRYGAAGYDVALVARSAERLDELGRSLQADGVTTGWTAVDITDTDAFSDAVTRFGRFSDRIDVLHFNPSAFRHQDPLTLTARDLLVDVHLGAASLLTAVQAARPFMSAGARITATGSMAADQPWHEAASLGVQKAGLRNLVHSLDATLSPDGIRAVSVTVRGMLGEEGPFTAARVAEAIHADAHQDEASWASEVPYSG